MNPKGNPNFKCKSQLCWDCANATNSGCSWSAEFKPVKGWEAERVEQRIYKQGYVIDSTYRVKSCPEFVRDAQNHGQERLVVGFA